MIKRKKACKINLSKDEEERLLWHGVKGNHPSVIYSSNKEAFDVSFSSVFTTFLYIYFSHT